jgi:hypothetical protein
MLMPYVVMVADNFHYMDESEQYRLGEYASAEEAIARCRQIVDEFLDGAQKSEGGASAAELWKSYSMFGEDPFILARDVPPVEFSAWTYARARCEERCGGPVDIPEKS